MLEFGEITEIDELKCRAKVRLPEYDNIETGWLKLVFKSSVGNKDYEMPQEGTQVACILTEDRQSGIIVGCTYNDEDKPPEGVSKNVWHKSFSDGTAIEYDKTSHKLTATLCDGGIIETNVKIKAKEIEVDEATINGIKFTTHKHQGDSGGITGVPQ